MGILKNSGENNYSAPTPKPYVSSVRLCSGRQRQRQDPRGLSAHRFYNTSSPNPVLIIPPKPP
jgi:hypothetical protein